jgi:hypothetical protein
MPEFWSDPPPQHYRYTVKCDRERFHAIERAAKACGLSASQLVQMHFESILDAEPAAQPEPRQPDQPARAELELATRSGMTVAALRIYRAVEDAADEHGRAEIGIGTISRQTGYTEGTVRTLLSRLTTAGRLRRLSGEGFRRTTVYRVNPLEGADGTE